MKRKATHQKDPNPESGIVPKTPGGGKKQKELIEKDTLRRTSARKTADKLKRATEENNHLLFARGTKDVPLQDVAPQERGVEAISSDGLPKEQKVQPPSLPQTLRRTELRRRLGQNKAFLPALERALIKARGRLAVQPQGLKQGPASREREDGQCMVWLLEDSIQKVKAGTYHLR